MLSSAPARPASSDLSFFSPSKSKSIVSTTPPNVVVTTTRRTRPSPARYASTSAASSSTSSPPPQNRKRKPPSATIAVSRAVKRLRPSGSGLTAAFSKKSSAAPSCSSSRAVSPEPIYRSSRSRSTSVFPTRSAPINVQHEWGIDEDGTPGEGFTSAEVVVRDLIRSYKGYFKNLDDPSDTSFEPHPTKYPFTELEYPNSNASERFILLAPKDKDHYNPIMCLQKSLYTIVQHYLTPKQQSLFGAIPTDILSDVTPPSSSPSSPPSSPSAPSLQASPSSSLSSLSTLSSESSLSPLSSLSSSNSSTIPHPRPNYLRAIQRAIHRQDGPLFLETMEIINKLLHDLKYPRLFADPFVPSPPNALAGIPYTWTTVPKPVLLRIIDETYQRSVGPAISTLRNYEAFSSSVYGELMPSFIADIVDVTGVGPGSLFLDLGSGVGNVVAQAALQSGCKAYGIELMPAPARVAREQLAQIRTRCRMWGVRMGEVELEEGDMLQSGRVTELMGKADVVLVNNKVFLESLNEALRPKFLDLKEGALVVSLKPFVSSLNARVTERNVDDISAIFDVTERTYHSGSVSWGSGGGSYYMHRVDREGYAVIRQRFERSRTGTTRSRR